MTRTTTARSLLPRRAAVGALAALVLVLAPACGGDDDSAEGSADATEETTADTSSASDGSTSDGSSDAGGGDTEPADDGLPDVDVCETVTAEQVSAALDGAEIVAAVPNEAIPAPTCDYMVSYDGVELPAVKVVAYEPGFVEGQRSSNTSATPLDGLDDAVLVDDIGYAIFVAGSAADYQIDRGVELTSGGEVATDAQMLAVATLFQDA